MTVREDLYRRIAHLSGEDLGTVLHLVERLTPQVRLPQDVSAYVRWTGRGGGGGGFHTDFEFLELLAQVPAKAAYAQIAMEYFDPTTGKLRRGMVVDVWTDPDGLPSERLVTPFPPDFVAMSRWVREGGDQERPLFGYGTKDESEYNALVGMYESRHKRPPDGRWRALFWLLLKVPRPIKNSHEFTNVARKFIDIRRESIDWDGIWAEDVGDYNVPLIRLAEAIFYGDRSITITEALDVAKSRWDDVLTAFRLYKGIN